MYGWSFDKINVIFACCEDIYSRYCIKKSNNDHFHPFALILFNIKSCSFSVANNDCDFLYWKNLPLVFAPEKPRDVAFILPVLKRVQRWQASWRSINVFKKVGSLPLHPAPNLEDQEVTLCLVSTLWPFRHAWPYQEYGVIETRELPHHDKVVTPIRAAVEVWAVG